MTCRALPFAMYVSPGDISISEALRYRGEMPGNIFSGKVGTPGWDSPVAREQSPDKKLVTFAETLERVPARARYARIDNYVCRCRASNQIYRRPRLSRDRGHVQPSTNLLRCFFFSIPASGKDTQVRSATRSRYHPSSRVS